MERAIRGMRAAPGGPEAAETSRSGREPWESPTPDHMAWLNAQAGIDTLTFFAWRRYLLG